LQSFYENEEINRLSSSARLQINAPEKIIEKLSDPITTDENAADHDNILQLSENGLTSKQISQKVLAPIEEVELVLRMNARINDRERHGPLRFKA
jgi:hypothetical protein